MSKSVEFKSAEDLTNRARKMSNHLKKSGFDVPRNVVEHLLAVALKESNYQYLLASLDGPTSEVDENGMINRCLNIDEWVLSGVHGLDAPDTDTLLDDAGRLLDKAYSHEIVGECLFKSGDKYFVGNVEFMITEANPDYVKDVLEELHYCHECGQKFITTESGVTHHVDEDGEIDYDADADHVPFGTRE